jgi:hypothetical protein
MGPPSYRPSTRYPLVKHTLQVNLFTLAFHVCNLFVRKNTTANVTVMHQGSQKQLDIIV